MKNLTPPLIVVGTLLGILLFYRYVYDGTYNTKSSLDNNYYKVRSNDNRQQKADLLALIKLKLGVIVENLAKSQYSLNPSVQRLMANWSKGVSVKEIGNMESDAAYVINKQYMSFCLPSDVGNSPDNINLMTYVGIHELSHVMSNEIGHGSEFIENFEFLLNFAKTLTYFDPVLEQTLPVYIQLNKMNTADNYCGVPIKNSIN
jgi:hypothetical protein